MKNEYLERITHVCQKVVLMNILMKKVGLEQNIKKFDFFSNINFITIIYALPYS